MDYSMSSTTPKTFGIGLPEKSDKTPTKVDIYIMGEKPMGKFLKCLIFASDDVGKGQTSRYTSFFRDIEKELVLSEICSLFLRRKHKIRTYE